jgi:hypothetical protein
MRHSRGGVLTIGLFFTCATAAASGPLEPQVNEYAAKHNLPVRTVKIRLDNRAVDRTVVPVLPETYADFLQHMTQGKPGLVLQYSDGNQEHPVAFLQPNAGWTAHSIAGVGGAERLTDPTWYAKTYEGGQAALPGRMLTIALEEDQLGYLKNHWNTASKPLNGRSGCMWWFVHAEVGKDAPLAHAFGVTRSGAASNLLKKMIHAGNDRVGVIGVMVPSIEAFNKKTDAELLGPPPGGGPDDAVRP